MAARGHKLLLSLLVFGVRAGLSIEVDNKLDLWDDWVEVEYENEVKPRPPQKVPDVPVVIPVDNAVPSTAGDYPDVPVFVPVDVVTPSTRKPAAAHPWKPHGSFAPTTTAAKDVPLYVPIASSGTGDKLRPKQPPGDVPVIIGSGGVKHVSAGGRDKTASVVIPISINISAGQAPPAPGDVPVVVGTAHHKYTTTTTSTPPPDVPVVVGTAHHKPTTSTPPPDVPVVVGTAHHKSTTSTPPPDVPVVYGLKLGPQFHRGGGAPPPRHSPSKRFFWLPPVVGLVPRPIILPPLFRPQPWQPPAAPQPPPAAPSRPSTTTAAPINVDGKLDFSGA